jgi:hypothetical protein
MRVSAEFDPAQDWLPVRIVSEYDDPKTKTPRGINTLQVLQTMAVSDHLAGRNIMMPQLIKLSCRRLEEDDECHKIVMIDSLALNEPIPAALFSPAIPPGVSVVERPATPGARPRVYISGGRAAEKAYLEKHAKRVSAELATTPRDTLNATPPQRSLWPRILFGAACAFLLAAIAVWRRKQTTP